MFLPFMQSQPGRKKVKPLASSEVEKPFERHQPRKVSAALDRCLDFARHERLGLIDGLPELPG
jgi:hypothetical protein